MTEEKTLSKETMALLKKLKDESMANNPIEYIETGNIGFDLAMSNGKGIPIGSSTLLWSEHGVGKSTIFVDVCKRLLTNAENGGMPFKVAYIASEDSKELILNMGMGKYLENGTFLYLPYTWTWNLVSAVYESAIRKVGEFKDVNLIVIDSISNILSTAYVDKAVDKGDLGTKAKERYNFYMKYLMACHTKGITSFLIAQSRPNTDVTLNKYAPKFKMSGSEGDKHYADIIIKCQRKSLAGTGEVATGSRTVFSDKAEEDKYILKMESQRNQGGKNRYFNGSPAELLVHQGKGIQNYYALLVMLKAHGLLKIAGGWFEFSDEFTESLGLPANKKYRRKDVVEYIIDNMGAIVEYLKSVNKYKLNLDGEVVITDSGDSNEYSEYEEVEVDE